MKCYSESRKIRTAIKPQQGNREKMVLKRKDDERKEMLVESQKKNKVQRDLKERVLEFLDQADNGLGSLHYHLDKAKR